MSTVPLHVILDRDGVLNVEAADGGFVQSPAQWQWLPGALDALRRLAGAGVRVSVATNQSGVGRGLMTAADLAAVNARMQAEAAASGGAIAAVFICPHAPDAGCDCRKPAPGLLHDAVAVSGVAAERTIVVGDDLRDLQAAEAAGLRCALVRTGKGGRCEAHATERGIAAYDDLAAFAAAVLPARDGAGGTAADARRLFAASVETMQRAAGALPDVLERMTTLAHECLVRGGTVFAAGNGGSAADAQHLVAELVGRFREDRRPWPAVALGTDPGTLTALSNDYGYEHALARQLDALARPGDLLLAISTSGNSPNVLAAARAARARGCRVIALTGAGGGRLAEQADLLCAAPSTVVARVQEVHGFCIHAWIDMLELRLATGAGA